MAVQGFIEVAGYSSTDLQNRYNEGYADGYDACKEDLEELQVQENGTYNAEALDKVGFSEVVVDVPDRDYAYLEPQMKKLTPIADGGSSVVLAFYFNLEVATRVRFYSTLNFAIALTTAGTPAQVTVTYGWDSEASPTPITQTYGEGNHVLTVDFLLPELSAGSHLFSVRLGITGGALS